DLELLADIARWGGGRYYFTEDIRAIPQIFVTEATLISRPLGVDGPCIPQWHQQADFWHDRTPVPPLGGYVVTSPKAAAAVHLKAPDESPILATWRRGLGKAAAFTASAGEPWIGAWRDWEGYGALMSQLVRWLMRSDPPAGLLPQIAIEGGRGILTVDALDLEGGFQNFLELAAEVLAPGGERLTLALDQVAPGRYEAEFPAGRPGPYLASIRSAGGDLPSAAWTGAASPYPEEYRVLRPDSGLLLRLAEATGGAVLSDPGPAGLRALLTHPAPSVRAVPLAPYLLAAALILAFLDIAVRYVPLSAIAGLLGTLRPRRLGAAGAVTDEQALRRMMAQDAEGGPVPCGAKKAAARRRRRRARRAVGRRIPPRRAHGPPVSLFVAEEAGDLRPGGFRAVRGVHHVVRVLQGEVAPDGARRRFERIGRPDEVADVGDGSRSLQDAHDHGPGGDGLDQFTEERLVGVVAVVNLSQLRLDLPHCQPADREPFALKPREDLPYQPPGHRLGLDDDERLLHLHLARTLLLVAVEFFGV